MLPGANRLRKTTEIERVWKRGRSFFNPLLQFKIAPNGLPLTRFAVVVGIKAHKRAVKRNLVKRRVREALRALLPEIAPGFDAIVTGKREAVDADFAAISKAVGDGLRAARILPRA